MYFCSYSKVSVDFRPLSINYDDTQTGALGLVLSEIGICIVGFEILNLLEVRSVLCGAHSGVLEGRVQEMISRTVLLVAEIRGRSCLARCRSGSIKLVLGSSV